MFEIGSLLIYDTTGVCKVEDIGVPSGFPVSDKNKKYYKLAPVFGSGTIYIPVETKVFMRPVISRDEAEALIRKIPEIREDICESHNQKVLEDHYKASLMTHDCEDLVQLIKTVYAKKKNLERNGKKTGKTDQTYMKRAKQLLHEELSIALDIPVAEVEDYITRAVEG
ncbi:MAG: CarD family transcriptional regulator [Lachnospiraceae bacterium]|nr:CarD family transcriptional regulator [Lachnospiraceae bacterium]